MNKTYIFYFFKNSKGILFKSNELDKYNIQTTNYIYKSTHIFCYNLKYLILASILFPFKKIVLYQEELTICKLRKINFFRKICVISGYTGDIYFNNYHFLGSYLSNESSNIGIDLNFKLNKSHLANEEKFNLKKQIIFISKFQKSIKNNKKKNIYSLADLRYKRQKLAIKFMESGFGYVHGHGWKNSYKTPDSWQNGNKDWYKDKLEILKDFRFNLCFENTNWDYYVTEKIWHSILAGSLPVYWGNNTIYESFPADSFVDASEFKDDESLIKYLLNMDYQTWKNLMIKCIDAYNSSIDESSKKKKFEESIIKFRNKIDEYYNTA